jgi:hypothetical protein
LERSPNNSNPYDTSLYKFSGLTIDRNGSTDTEVAGAIDATIPFEILGYSAAIKFGTNLRFKTKERYDDPQTFSTYEGPAVNGQNDLTLSDVAGGSFQTDYNGYYRLGYSPSVSKWESFYAAHRSGFVRNAVADEVTSLQAYYDDTENIYAGYAQGDITVGASICWEVPESRRHKRNMARTPTAQEPVLRIPLPIISSIRTTIITMFSRRYRRDTKLQTRGKPVFPTRQQLGDRRLAKSPLQRLSTRSTALSRRGTRS